MTTMETGEARRIWTPSGAAPSGAHPLAGTPMTGAEIVVQVLADEGVDTVFGYSGGAILPTYDAVFRYNREKSDNGGESIRLVVPANEQGAGFMAAGYARATGKVGCFIVTSGPGATNCVTPIRDCAADSVPVVLICGQVPRAAIGSDAFQEAPVFNIMSACAKHAFLVEDPEKLEETVRSAFEIARSGRPGPVVIELPKDVQNWEGAFKGSGKLHFRGFERRMEKLNASGVSERRCQAFFDMLAQSERPLVYAGGGVVNGNAAEELRAFMDAFDIPAVTTLMGIGSVDTRDPKSLGMLGMHGAAHANYAVEDCDFLITVGARFDDRVAGKVAEFAPGARNIAHIDIDAAEVGKVKAVTWAHVGPIARAMTDLLNHGKATGFARDYSGWLEHLAGIKGKYAFNYDRQSRLIQPYYVLERLTAITKGDAVIATGVGQHQMWASQYCDFHKPRHWLTSGSMGTMGFGLPAAIGAKAGCPDKIVIDVDGDGSIRMNLGERETATTYGFDVKVLLLNNSGDGMVRQWQKLFFGERFSGSDKTLHNKDFVKAAEADGYKFARRLRVDEVDQVEETLREFVEFDGAAFLEVQIDPDACVFPMVGPGMGYKQMVTGEWIPVRAETDEEPRGIQPVKKADLF